MASGHHFCADCGNSVFTIRKSTLQGGVNINKVICMDCGSDKEPVMKMVDVQGRLIKTGIRKKMTKLEGEWKTTRPKFGKERKLEWEEIALTWARMFDKKLEEL